MKKLISATVVALSLSTAAQAETFDGPYAGINVGHDNYELKAKDLDIGVGVVSADGLSANGIGGGIYAGYNFDLGGAFVGIEGNLDLSDAGIIASGTDGTQSGSLALRAKESYGLTGRLGFKVSESTALYTKLGWMNTRFKGAVNDNGVRQSDSDGQSGMHYGLGLQSYLSDNMSLRAEYTFSDYGSADIADGIKVDGASFRAGLSFHF